MEGHWLDRIGWKTDDLRVCAGWGKATKKGPRMSAGQIESFAERQLGGLISVRVSARA